MSILGTEFDNAVERLKQVSTDFMNIYYQFVNIPVEYRTDNWGTVKNRAEYVQGIISSITSSIDSAYKWATATFGLEGLSGLGLAIPMALPITVAAIGAAISTIMVTYSYMTEELNKSSYAAEMDRVNLERVARGESPVPVGDYRAANDPFGLANLSSMVKWVAIGGFIIVVAPKLLEKMKK